MVFRDQQKRGCFLATSHSWVFLVKVCVVCFNSLLSTGWHFIWIVECWCSSLEWFWTYFLLFGWIWASDNLLQVWWDIVYKMYLKCNDGLPSELLNVRLLVTRLFIMSLLSHRINYLTVELYELTLPSSRPVPKWKWKFFKCNEAKTYFKY